MFHCYNPFMGLPWGRGALIWTIRQGHVTLFVVIYYSLKEEMEHVSKK